MRRLGRYTLRYVDDADAWSLLPSGICRSELLHAIDDEDAVTVEDVMRRRLALEYFPTHGMESLEAVAGALGSKVVGISVDRQVAAWKDRLATLERLLGKRQE